jgi:biopolymer transport protein ExbD
MVKVQAAKIPFSVLCVALILCLTVIAVGCSRPSRGLLVRIARVGACSGPRDIILDVLPGGGLNLNSEYQKRAGLGDRLDNIFRTRVERYVFIEGDPNATFGEVAEVINIAARHVDYVSLVTPSIREKATYRGGGDVAHDDSEDTCLNPNLPVNYITHTTP